jgi:ribosomal protein S18 acetylase RimI-like enzyme
VAEASPPVACREMVEADLADALKLSRASGWNQTLEDWRLLLSLGPGLFRVVEQEGRVVASAGAVRYGDALAWLCMVLVLPERRGQGVGKAVFEEVLARLDAGGGASRCVGLDATPAGRALYLRRGFRDGPSLTRLQLLQRPTAPAAGVRPLRESDLPAVLERDRVVFGADRAVVLRHALSAAPRLAWIARDGAAAGYCLGRHGDHSDHVGPVVARDLELARALVLAGAASGTGRPLIVDAFARPPWAGALTTLGFEPQRAFTRMHRGASPAAGEPALAWAACGPEFG